MRNEFNNKRMIVSAHQPNFLPWIGFFHKMMTSDCFILLDNVQFRKRNYQNRTLILGQKKKSSVLTCPVNSKGSFKQSIQEVKIHNDIKWNLKLLETIRYYYGKAPFFLECYDPLKEIISKKWEYLADLNIALLMLLLDLLGIRKEIRLASKIKAVGSSTNLLLNLLEKVGGTHYLSGIKGKDYLEESKFKERGISLIYQQFKHPVYTQNGNPQFVPGLSIIDLLFNIGIKESRNILNRSVTQNH